VARYLSYMSGNWIFTKKPDFLVGKLICGCKHNEERGYLVLLYHPLFVVNVFFP
jgi:hypothetical protein